MVQRSGKSVREAGELVRTRDWWCFKQGTTEPSRDLRESGLARVLSRRGLPQTEEDNLTKRKQNAQNQTQVAMMT